MAQSSPQPTPQADSPWSLKPWWCQPWSIVLTGVSITGGSWLLLHRIWVTALVALPIGVWMGFFVLLWPKLMQQAMSEASRASD